MDEVAMSKGVFKEKNNKPTDEDIYKSLDAVKPLWDGLISFIEDNYQIQGDLIFYGKNFGWAQRYKKAGRVLIAIYPRKLEFLVQIILNENEVEEVLRSDITTHTRKIINETNMIREGKWIYLTVIKESDLKDIKQLIMARYPLE
jgi:hypothetical protein